MISSLVFLELSWYNKKEPPSLNLFRPKDEVQEEESKEPSPPPPTVKDTIKSIFSLPRHTLKAKDEQGEAIPQEGTTGGLVNKAIVNEPRQEQGNPGRFC